MPLSALWLIPALAAVPLHSPLVGSWMTPNHSVVGIYACGSNKLCARLEKIGPQDKPRVDVQNPDASQRGRNLCGLTLANDFELETPDHAISGHIYDPESGKTYSAEIAVTGDDLKLRGFIGVPLFGRTETWHRTGAPSAATPC